MSSLRGAYVTVVTNDESADAVRTERLRALGAEVTIRHPQELLVADWPVDVIVMGHLDATTRTTLVEQLRTDLRLRGVPRVAFASAWRPSASEPPVPRAECLPLRDEIDDEELLGTLRQLVELRSAVTDLAEQAASLSDELRLRARTANDVRRTYDGLVHDVRVLLGVAMGFACNLRDGFVGAVTDEQKAAVARIVDAVKDASGLLEQAPTTTTNPRLAAISVPPPATAPAASRTQRTLVRVDEVAREVVLLFEASATAKGLELRADLPEAVRLWGTRTQLKQIVTNLVVNALKYTPTGGSIVVRVRTAASEASHGFEARRVAEIEVTDSGPGVPKDERERIFQRGVRLDRDVNSAGKGIGLAVVRELVIAHGGMVRVEDARTGERGASFLVRMPLDLRRRARSGLLVLRAGQDADQFLEIFRDAANGRLDVLATRDEAFLSSALAARAVVMVADGNFPEAIRHLVTDGNDDQPLSSSLTRRRPR